MNKELTEKAIELEEEIRQRNFVPEIFRLENVELPRGLDLPETLKKKAGDNENESN